MSKLTLSFKGKILKVYPVLNGTMVIGSDPGCTVLIDSLAVQPRHAEVTTANNQTTIRDLGTPDGTFINQAKLEGPHVLKDGELIRVGKHTLSYTYEEMPDRPEVSAATTTTTTSQPVIDEEPVIKKVDNRQGWLQIMSGQNLGKTMSLNRAMTNLGKPGMSMVVISKRNDGYFISQLEGEHPSTVQNQPIGDKPLKLTDGDLIQIGNVKMQFYLE